MKEQKEEREERICRSEARQTGARDHGCSLRLAEDLGRPANPVSGSGTSGEWMGKVEPCRTQGCRGMRALERGQRALDLLML